MQDKAPSRRISRKPYIALGVLVAVVIGGWSLYWTVARGAIVDVLANSRKAMQANGGELACANQSVAGFPFHFEVSCAPLQVGGAAGERVNVAGFRAVALAYNPWHLIFEADAPLELSPAVSPRPAGLAPAVSAGWQSARASVRIEDEALGRADAVFAAPEIALALAGTGGVPVKVGSRSGELHLRRASDTAAGVDAALSLDRVRTAPGLPPVDFKVVAHLPQAAPLLQGRVNGSLVSYMPVPDGLGITRLSVTDGTTTVNANGALGFDGDGYVNGSLDVTVVGVDRLAEALKPFFPQGSGIPESLQGALQGFGRQSELDDAPASTVTVNFERGTARVGLIPLGRIPPAS